jgi:hypothetical protein
MTAQRRAAVGSTDGAGDGETSRDRRGRDHSPPPRRQRISHARPRSQAEATAIIEGAIERLHRIWPTLRRKRKEPPFTVQQLFELKVLVTMLDVLFEQYIERTGGQAAFIERCEAADARDAQRRGRSRRAP